MSTRAAVWNLGLSVLATVLVSAACGSTEPAAAPEPAATAVAATAPSATPVPSATVAPTATVVPTATPIPAPKPIDCELALDTPNRIDPTPLVPVAFGVPEGSWKCLLSDPTVTDLECYERQTNAWLTSAGRVDRTALVGVIMYCDPHPDFAAREVVPDESYAFSTATELFRSVTELTALPLAPRKSFMTDTHFMLVSEPVDGRAWVTFRSKPERFLVGIAIVTDEYRVDGSWSEVIIGAGVTVDANGEGTVVVQEGTNSVREPTTDDYAVIGEYLLGWFRERPRRASTVKSEQIFIAVAAGFPVAGAREPIQESPPAALDCGDPPANASVEERSIEVTEEDGSVSIVVTQVITTDGVSVECPTG